MDYLQRRFGLPLEREYEAWIVRQIEAYFKVLGIEIVVFAVSPEDEKTWPADEVVAHKGKLVGLQFKRAHLSSPSATPNNFPGLFWDLSSPTGQLQLVANHTEIFYCLPTFVNREVRPRALHHCLFWRPDDDSHKQAWYCNHDPRVRTKHNCIADAKRWGRFVELFLECNVGRKLAELAFVDYMRQIVTFLRGIDGNTETTIYYIYLAER